MKIAIIAPGPVPFCIGGAEKAWWAMLDAIHQHTDHQADIIKIPSPERTFAELIASYQAFSRLDLSHFDQVISTKYPAWMVHHPNHTVYLWHRLRGLYDTYPPHFPRETGSLPAGFSRLQALLQSRPRRQELDNIFSEISHLLKGYPESFAFPGPLTRLIIHYLDGVALAPDAIRSYFAISENVLKRENYFPAAVPVEVIHTPLPRAGKIAYERSLPPLIFTVSRLDAPKRLDLLIRAFLTVQTDLEFHIAGSGPQLAELKKLARGDHRIKFLGWCSDTEIAQHYERSVFVPFVPYDEDYGLVTLEAMRAGRPVLTVSDAGGVLELVHHGETGLIVEPQVAAVAQGMRQLLADPQKTAAMGQAASASVAHITWEKAIKTLLRSRPLLVVVATFAVYPPRGGGQSRLYHLFRNLTSRADIVLLTLTSDPELAGEIIIEPGLREIRVLRSLRHRGMDWHLARQLQAAVEDIGAIDHTRYTPEFTQKLSVLCRQAEKVIVSHPFLYNEVRLVWDGPVWYEAQDVEVDVKAAVLRKELAEKNPAALAALERVRAMEAACCREAERVFVVSEEDGARMEELYGDVSPELLANGVDVERVTFTGVAARLETKKRLGIAGFTALFMGSWHGPNIEAMERLAAMADRCPAVDFLIMGSVCNCPLASVPANLHLLGVLGEAEKGCLMSGVDLALNPMESGSGTNLKMLEYAAAGILIVSSVFGNRGLRFVDGEHVLISATEDFPDSINMVLRNGLHYYAPIIARARKLVEDHYSWQAVARKLEIKPWQ